MTVAGSKATAEYAAAVVEVVDANARPAAMAMAMGGSGSDVGVGVGCRRHHHHRRRRCRRCTRDRQTSWICKGGRWIAGTDGVAAAVSLAAGVDHVDAYGRRRWNGGDA